MVLLPEVLEQVKRGSRDNGQDGPGGDAERWLARQPSDKIVKIALAAVTVSCSANLLDRDMYCSDSRTLTTGSRIGQVRAGPPASAIQR
jgi:hypothetical protein